MTLHDFTLTLAGEDVLTPKISNALHDTGINGEDTLVLGRGRAVFDFEREAESLGDVVGATIKQVERAGFKVAQVQVGESGAHA